MGVLFVTLASALVVIGCCLATVFASPVITEPPSGNADQKEGSAEQLMDNEFTEYDDASIIFEARADSESGAASAGLDKELNVDVRFFNKSFTLKLNQNENLIHPMYTEKTIALDGTVTYQPKTSKAFDECYYTGKVANDDQSVAAVSTCNGFNAEIMAEGEMYHVIAIDNTLGGRHKAYRQSNSTLPPSLCGVNNTASIIHNTQEFLVSRKKRDINWPQDLDGITRMIEVYIVIDYSQFVSQGNSMTAVSARTKEMVNIVSSLYQSQHIYVSLVGMEVWSTGSLIVINQSDSQSTLAGFSSYRRDNITTPNDNAHLITTGQYEAGIIGKAYVGKMCTNSLSAAFDSEISAAVGVIATTMAHEMGHNLGLLHDTAYPSSCACDDAIGVCIMYPSIDSANLQTHWSQCSKDNLASFTSELTGFCLNDFNGQLFDPTPVCGNGLVETGEQCDCGNAPITECNPSCCNAITCQLMSSSDCAAGRCCDVATCKLEPITTECRAASGSCDLAEYCSGVNNTCPSDVFGQDGTSCSANGVASYCYGGACKSHGTQCELWWGPGVQNSVDVCYELLNVIGRADGNCRYNAGVYIACNVSDYLCGTLHCDLVVTNFAQAQIPANNLYNSNLKYVDGSVAFNCAVGSFIDADPLLFPDPGYVPNGASCGSDKMCLDRQCVDVSSVLNERPCPSCNQHGVCNSLGQCHCDVGYAPPDCILPGNGGSYHSNPIEILSTTASLETTQPVTTTTITTAAVTSAEATTEAIVTSVATSKLLTTDSPTTIELASTTVLTSTGFVTSVTATTVAPIVTTTEQDGAMTTTIEPATTEAVPTAIPTTDVEVLSTATPVQSTTPTTTKAPVAPRIICRGPRCICGRKCRFLRKLRRRRRFARRRAIRLRRFNRRRRQRRSRR